MEEVPLEETKFSTFKRREEIRREEMVIHYILNKQWISFKMENHMGINQSLEEKLNTHLMRTHIPSFWEEDKITYDKNSNGDLMLRLLTLPLLMKGKIQNGRESSSLIFFPKENSFGGG